MVQFKVDHKHVVWVTDILSFCFAKMSPGNSQFGGHSS